MTRQQINCKFLLLDLSHSAEAEEFSNPMEDSQAFISEIAQCITRWLKKDLPKKIAINGDLSELFIDVFGDCSIKRFRKDLPTDSTLSFRYNLKDYTLKLRPCNEKKSGRVQYQEFLKKNNLVFEFIMLDSKYILQETRLVDASLSDTNNISVTSFTAPETVFKSDETDTMDQPTEKKLISSAYSEHEESYLIVDDQPFDCSSMTLNDDENRTEISTLRQKITKINKQNYLLRRKLRTQINPSDKLINDLEKLITNVHNNLKDEAQCPVTLDEYGVTEKTAKLTISPCGHHLSLYAFKQLIKTGAGTVKCPQCRVEKNLVCNLDLSATIINNNHLWLDFIHNKREQLTELHQIYFDPAKSARKKELLKELEKDSNEMISTAILKCLMEGKVENVKKLLENRLSTIKKAITLNNEQAATINSSEQRTTPRRDSTHLTNNRSTYTLPFSSSRSFSSSQTLPFSSSRSFSSSQTLSSRHSRTQASQSRPYPSYRELFNFLETDNSEDEQDLNHIYERSLREY